MKYYLFDFDNIPISEADDIKTALQVFGEVYDENPDVTKEYLVQIFLEIKPGKMKFYNCYYLPDFLNKSPEFFEATPEQEDAHTVNVKDQYGNNVTVKTSKGEQPKLMTDKERKAFNAGDDKAFMKAAANFTDEEYTAVLQYIPTGFILGEIARRLEEYNKATNEILSTIDNMKLFQNDDKKGN